MGIRNGIGVDRRQTIKRTDIFNAEARRENAEWCGEFVAAWRYPELVVAI